MFPFRLQNFIFKIWILIYRPQSDERMNGLTTKISLQILTQGVF